MTRPLTELGTPESVREVVGQRLSRLAPKTTDLLELAAVAGPEFELEPIRRAAGLSRGRAARRPRGGGGKRHDRGAAARSGSPVASPTRSCGGRSTTGSRGCGGRSCTSASAEALERAGGASDRALADLAHHFGAAAPFGGAERADRLQPARGAARRAPRSPSTMPATRLRTAIEIGIEDEAERAGVLLELGSASHRAGKATDAQEAFVAAAEIARGLDSAELLARAAIGYEEACWRPGIASGEVSIELLEEALAAVGEEDDELRIGLLAGLARGARLRRASRERGRDRARQRGRAGEGATATAAALAKVLVRSYWARGTTPLEEILAMLTEARDLAEELGDAETQTEAMAWRVPTFVALCDLDSARAEVAALREMAERTAQPFMNHVAEHYGSAIALCDGNLAEAEAMAERSREWGRLLTGRDASGTYGIQMFGIRREQGRLAELAPAVRILAGQRRPRGAVAPRAGRRARRAGHGARGEARAGARSPPRASTASGPRCGWRRSPT